MPARSPGNSQSVEDAAKHGVALSTERHDPEWDARACDAQSGLGTATCPPGRRNARRDSIASVVAPVREAHCWTASLPDAPYHARRAAGSAGAPDEGPDGRHAHSERRFSRRPRGD
jgi:hypothetical protein